MVSDSPEKSTRFENLKMKITSVIGYLLPLMASLPPLAAWSGLMTVPFIIYLLLMFGNATTTPLPLPDMTHIGTFLLVTASGVGLLLLLYSVVYLWRAKSKGLVTSGPYRICRHPQYFSLIIITLLMNYQSIWILQHTFGMGWLTVYDTWLLWILMLGAYVVIAWAEEMHLAKQFGKEWEAYRRKVGFLIPFIPLKYYILEALVAIIVPVVILGSLLTQFTIL
jgi:protein-S-isoprenylcysteine O-methyltransferase Ste14